MKSKLLIYVLPVFLAAFLIYGYSTQDDPRNDAAPNYNTGISPTDRFVSPSQSDTSAPPNFPYPKQFGWVYENIGGVSAGTVGATYFQGKYILNRWNSATLYRYNDDGPGGGPGTLADSNTAYNGGTGAIRDMAVAPDGSGTEYLWGGAASSTLYKMDANGNRIASYTQAGAVYRTIAWDPNRKGFWSSNFSDNIVLRDTLGTVLRTINATTLTGKYGLAFDSTSTADSAFLWVWSQNFSVATDTTNDLVKISLASGLPVQTYNFNKIENIAGGADTYIRDNKFILSLNLQNYAVVGYVLKDLSPPSGGGSVTLSRTVNKAIMDNGGNAVPVLDTINISGIPGSVEIKKVTLTLDNVPHTWIGDLRFWLTKDGSVVDTVVSRVGWTGTGFGNSCDNFTGTILLDSVGPINVQNMTPATCATGLPANSTGTFNPAQPFSQYQNSGVNPNGSYVLRVSDNAAGDLGTLIGWTLKIDYDIITGVNNNVTSIPNEFSLNQNYPNPFNPSTKIAYTIPTEGLVTLKIFNILGKEVASLVNEVKTAGSYEVNFNAASLSSGVYFYRLESGKFIDTKKMFLLK